MDVTWPDKPLVAVFTHLDALGAVRLRRTCRRFAALDLREADWRAVYANTLGREPPPPPAYEARRTWRERCLELAAWRREPERSAAALYFYRSAMTVYAEQAEALGIVDDRPIA